MVAGTMTARRADVRSHQRGTVSVAEFLLLLAFPALTRLCAISASVSAGVKVQRIARALHNKFPAYLHSFVVVNNVQGKLMEFRNKFLCNELVKQSLTAHCSWP